MEIILKTNNGDQKVNTVPKLREVEPKSANALRRVADIDLSGPLGEFLAGALPFIAPGAFAHDNWKTKVISFVGMNTASFVVCGRAVGLAIVERDFMSGDNVLHGQFMLGAEGFEEEDAVAVLRAQKEWARGMNIAYVPPHKEYCSLSMSKTQVAVKAEKREELFVSALAKK